MTDPDAPAELPVACTLGPGDGAERMRRWQRLAASAPPTNHVAGGRLEVRFTAGPGVLEELRSLAAAEAECCSFADWVVTEQAGRPTLVVSAGDGPDSGDRIRPIAALFGAA